MTFPRQDEAAALLMRKGVRMVKKTVYEDNKPKSSSWLPVRYTKVGKFYQVNGKIIAKNHLHYAALAGLVLPND